MRISEVVTNNDLKTAGACLRSMGISGKIKSITLKQTSACLTGDNCGIFKKLDWFFKIIVSDTRSL